MASLVYHASQDSNSSLPGACTAWVDADEDAAFIQEDDSVPASLGQQSEADSEDVLDALIQHELTKFQQQQADKYAALLSEGQVVLPLPSPAPEQQQLRAQQKQQEALKDAASFEDVERIDYVPSARPTLDADHPLLQASSQYEYSQDQPQHSEEQQLQHPVEVSEPCTQVLHDGCHTWQAETSSAAAAAEPPLAAATSSSGAGEEAAHAADEVSDMHNTGDDTPADAANAMQQQQQQEQQPSCSISNTASPAASCQDIQAAAGKARTAPAQAEAEEFSGQQAEVGTRAAAAALVDPTAELRNTQCEPPMLADALAPAGGVADCLAASSPSFSMEGEQLASQQQQAEQHLAQPLQQHQLESTQPDAAGQSSCDAAGGLQGTTPAEASQQPSECAATSQEPWQAASYSLAAHQQHVAEAEQQPLSPVEQQVSVLPYQEQQQLLHTSCGELCPQRLASDDGSTQLLGCSGEPAASLGKDTAYQLPPQPGWQQQQQQPKEQQAAVEAAAPPSPPPDAAAVADDDVCLSPVEVAAGDVEESGVEKQAASAESPTPTSLALQRQMAPEAAAAAAAAAAIAAISQESEGLSPWQAYTEADCSSAQQGHTCSGKQHDWSGPAPADTTRQHSAHLSQQQSPRRQQEQVQQLHAQQQQHGYRPRSGGSSSMQRRPSPGSSSRPSSAPAGSRSRGSIPVSPMPRVMPHSMHAGILGMVAESSQEGMCCSSRSSMQFQPGPRHQSPGSNRLSSAAAAAEQHYQQQLIMHMQQLHLSRPTSADSWRSSQQPGRQQSPFDRQHRLQQLVRKPAPKWDDSPMPLHIPKTVPIAQATLLPSVTTAASAGAAAAFAARCSAGTGGSGGRNMSSCAAGGGRSDLSRPQTAGPVMLHSSSTMMSSQDKQQPAGSLTARSSSCSPDRRRQNLLLSSAGTTRRGSSSCSTRAGLAGAAELTVAGQQCCDSSRRSGGGGSRGGGAADAYLLDVLQQIRQANSCCRQLGLCMQYRLAKGSSKRDKWQLEQIEVELWSQVTGGGVQQHQGQQQQPWQLPPGEAAPPAAGASTWRLKRKLSLQQFTSHLSRLRGCTPASSTAAGGACVSGPDACLAGRQPWPCTLPSAADRGLSPDRCQARIVASSRASSSSSSQASQVLDPAGSIGSNMPRSGGTAVGSCQLLVLSPRASRSNINSSCTDHMQCLVRPASAPRASSRLSPRRQQGL